MRITHAIASLDPAAGGPPQVVIRLASAQAALGHEVVIVSAEPADRKSAVDQMLDGVPGFEAVRTQPRPDPDQLRSTVAQSDVIHAHGVWEPMVRRSASAAHRCRTPLVLAPHGMLDPWSLNQKKWKKRLALALHYRRMLNRAAFLHVLNADEARLIQPLGLRCPAEVIPNGVFLEEIEPLPQPGTFRRERPELGDRPFILFLSRLHYKKGLDILAEAFTSVAAADDQVMLVVAGPDDGAQADFERRIDAAGLSGRTLLTGPIYGRMKYAAMVDAAGYCLPSRQEGFSIAITEALACGTSVVITRDCHYPEVAEVRAGHVTDLDAGQIASALIDQLGDPASRRQMADAGRQLVRERFTWPSIARLTIEKYQQFV